MAIKAAPNTHLTLPALGVENTVYIVHANAPVNPDATGSHGQSRIISPDGNIVKEASMFRQDVLRASLDLRQATAQNAKGSLNRGPLRDGGKTALRTSALSNCASVLR